MGRGMLKEEIIKVYHACKSGERDGNTPSAISYTATIYALFSLFALFSALPSVGSRSMEIDLGFLALSALPHHYSRA